MSDLSDSRVRETTRSGVRDTTLHGDVRPSPKAVRRLNPLVLWGSALAALIIILAILGAISKPAPDRAQARAAQAPPGGASPQVNDLLRDVLSKHGREAANRAAEPDYLLLPANRAQAAATNPGAPPIPPGLDPRAADYQRALLEQQMQQQQQATVPPPGYAGGNGGAARPSSASRARTSALLAASFGNQPNVPSSGAGMPSTPEISALSNSAAQQQRELFALLQQIRGGQPSPAGAAGGGAIPSVALPQPAAGDGGTTFFSQAAASQANAPLQLAQLSYPLSPFTLQQGTVLPATLLTGVTSDLAGQTIAVIRRPIYDSITGQFLLIPQGARLIGQYDARVAIGQNRLLTAWTRIIFPDGRSVALGALPATDAAGNVGMTDQVNNHYMRVFGGALLMSLFSASAQLTQPSQQRVFTTPSNSQIAIGAAGAELSETAAQLTSRNLSIKPTIILRPGTLFDVQVTRDLVFASPYTGDVDVAGTN